MKSLRTKLHEDEDDVDDKAGENDDDDDHKDREDGENENDQNDEDQKGDEYNDGEKDGDDDEDEDDDDEPKDDEDDGGEYDDEEDDGGEYDDDEPKKGTGEAEDEEKENDAGAQDAGAQDAGAPDGHAAPAGHAAPVQEDKNTEECVDGAQAQKGKSVDGAQPQKGKSSEETVDCAQSADCEHAEQEKTPTKKDDGVKSDDGVESGESQLNNEFILTPNTEELLDKICSTRMEEIQKEKIGEEKPHIKDVDEEKQKYGSPFEIPSFKLLSSQDMMETIVEEGNEEEAGEDEEDDDGMIVNVGTNLTELEKKVSNRLFVLQGDPSDLLFHIEGRNYVSRVSMESMIPNEMISSTVISAYTTVLNYEERFRGTPPYRLFLPVGFVDECMLKGKLELSSKSIIFYNCLKAHLRLLKIPDDLSTVQMLLFPMHKGLHYYVMVFDVQKNNVCILDNVKRFSDIDEIYGDVPARIHWMVVDVLSKYFNHSSAKKLEKVKPKILNMKWTTQENGFDCGVFVMRHMETFMGLPVSKWVTDLEKESNDQKRQLIMLRRKYATKILLFDLNLKKEMVLKESDEFDSIEDEVLKTEMLKNAYKNRKERMKLD